MRVIHYVIECSSESATNYPHTNQQGKERWTHENTDFKISAPFSNLFDILSAGNFLPFNSVVTIACDNATKTYPPSKIKQISHRYGMKKKKMRAEVRTVFSANPIRNLPSRARIKNLVSDPMQATNILLMIPIFFSCDYCYDFD